MNLAPVHAPHANTNPAPSTRPVVGLFGTCGASTWRRAFITAYEAHGVTYFNPQVDHWTPELGDLENEHFRRDAILLFPVTAETTGFGGLAEVGLAILEIERHNQRRPDDPRHLLVFVDPRCSDPAASEAQLKDSLRARKLVGGKLPAYASPFIHVCASLEDMLQRSLKLLAPKAT